MRLLESMCGVVQSPAIAPVLALFERIKKPRRDKIRRSIVCGGTRQKHPASTIQEGRRTLTGHLRSGEITLKHPHKLPWKGGAASVLFLPVSILIRSQIRISIFSSIPKSDFEEAAGAFLWWGILTGISLFRFINCFISAFLGKMLSESGQDRLLKCHFSAVNKLY